MRVAVDDGTADLAGLQSVPRREFLVLGSAMAASLLIVLAYIAVRHGHALAGDQIEYDREGRFFADGKPWWTTTPFGIAHAAAWKAPGYPAWVGLWYTLLGKSPTGVEIVQAFLAPVTVALAWLLARRLFGTQVAILSAWVAAAFPLIWEWNGLLYSESLATPLTLLAILLFLGHREVTAKRSLALGAVIGLAVLIRPSSVFLFAGVLASFALAVGLKRGIAFTAVSVAVAALMVAPWTIRNYIEYDAFLPISVQDGGTIAGTFNPDAAKDPKYPYAWRAIAPSVRDIYSRGNPVDDAELVAKLRSRAFDYIKHHPLSVLQAFYWNGLTRLWDVRRPARALDEAPLQGRSKKVAAVGLAMYYVLLPLALFGLWRARRRRDVVIPLLALALAASIVFTVEAGTRYRTPLEPLIVVLACSALVPIAVRAAELLRSSRLSSPWKSRAASLPRRTL